MIIPVEEVDLLILISIVSDSFEWFQIKDKLDFNE